MPPKPEKWCGFERVRNSQTGQLCGAKCLKCKYIMRKISSESLATHRRVCSNKSSNTIIVSEQDMAAECSSNESHSPDVQNDDDDDEPPRTRPRTIVKSSQEIQKQTPPGDFVCGTEKQIKDLALLKFCMYYNLEMMALEDDHFKQFLQVFDKNYKIPNLNEIENCVHTAFNSTYRNAKNNNCALMGILTKRDCIEEYFISFIIKNERYYFVMAELCTVDDNLTTSFMQFLNQSILKAKDIFQSTVRYVLLQSTIEVSSILEINGENVYVLLSLSSLITEISRKIDGFLVGANEHQEFLSEMHDKILNKNYYLSEAVEDVYSQLEKNLENFCEDFDSFQQRFFNGVALSANYFDPRFKNDMFKSNTRLNERLRFFLYQVLVADPEIDDDPLAGLHNFKSSLDVFAHLKKAEPPFERIQFWSIALHEGKNTKILSKLAIDLLKIPNSLRPLKIDILKKILEVNAFGVDNYKQMSVFAYTMLN